MGESNPVGQILLLVCLIGFEAVISIAKKSLQLSNESIFERRAEEEPENHKVKKVLKLLDQYDGYINVTRMIATAINVSLGVIYSGMFMECARKTVKICNIQWNTAVVTNVLCVLFFCIFIFLLLLFGLVLPKKLVMKDPDRTLYRMSGFMTVVLYVLKPFVVLTEWATNGILFIFRINPKDLEDSVTEDEIISIMNEGLEQGVLEDDEVEMISNIIEMDEKEVREIMTHRKKVVSIDAELSIEEALHFMLNESYTRFPLYEDVQENIIGILHLKDVTKYYMSGQDRQVPLKELAREAYFVPDTQKIDTLFDDMQLKKIHMAVAVDEYGQLAGIVAMEDILEEIVGNIFDEYDEVDERMIIKQKNNKYVMKGLTTLREVEEELGIDFEQEDFETLNGLLTYLLGHLPKEKEKAVLSYKGYHFHIVDAGNNVIRKVVVAKEEDKKRKS